MAVLGCCGATVGDSVLSRTMSLPVLRPRTLLQFGEELVLSGEEVGEDPAGGAQEFGDVASGEGVANAAASADTAARRSASG